MGACMGCVGNDDLATKMRAACERDGVHCVYMVDESADTGTCAVLVNGTERSLCTNLEAAKNYKTAHLQMPENWKILTEARIVYIAGFFVTVSPESIKLASREVARTGGIYCMNLSAPFIMQVPAFKAVLLDTMPYVDLLFGNETEA